jgi:hypothetical protein
MAVTAGMAASAATTKARTPGTGIDASTWEKETVT